jgi:drug/metabolite transporter (DMT)-like permease
MSMGALGLVILAGLIHATWNLVAKHAAGGIAFSALSSFAAVVLWSPLGVPVLIRESQSFGQREWLALIGSSVLHVLYFAALLRGYEVGDLSVVYPIARGTGPLITVAVSIIWLNERPGVKGLIGVLMIMGGVVLIARSSAQTSLEISSKRISAGVGFGLLTGVMIAAYSVLDGYTVKRLGVSPIALDYGSNLFRVVLTVPLAYFVLRHRSGTRGDSSGDSDQVGSYLYMRRNWKWATVVGLLSPVAYVLVLQAAKLSDLSRVAPAREVSMLFAALFAGTLLNEEGLALRIAGAVSIAAGVAFIAFG